VREETPDQMRNWCWMRKGGGAENSSDARSFAAANLNGLENDAGAVMAMTTAIGFASERAEASVMSRSRVAFAVVSRQLPAQHGIDESITAILLLSFPRQHAAAAGSAVTKSTSATANAVANRFVNVKPGFTIYPTPWIVSAFPAVRPCVSAL
jgi:hypothetical protein